MTSPNNEIFPFRKSPLVLAVGAVLSALPLSPAHACVPGETTETFSVTSLLDVIDAGDGLLTLREAIAAANATPECDTIVFDPGLDGGTISPQSTFEVFEDLNIEGPGSDLLTVDLSGSSNAHLNGNGIDLSISGLTFTGAVFSPNIWATDASAILLDDIVSVGSDEYSIQVDTAESVTIRNSTISGNGSADSGGGGMVLSRVSEILIEDSRITGNTSGFSGAGIFISAPVPSTVRITDTEISGNEAAAAAGNTGGGGIHVQGTAQLSMTLTGSTVDGNTSGRDGGGIYLMFNVVDTPSPELVIEDSVISNNAANLNDLADDVTPTFFTGGGIYMNARGADLTLTRSSVRDNGAANGGGINIVPNENPVNVTITDSTVSGNSADSSGTGTFGGGLLVSDNNAVGMIVITQSTFSGNNADEVGAGIYISADPSSTVGIRHSTISQNENLQSEGAAGIYAPGMNVLLDHTIVAGNGDAPDLAGTYDADYSLIGNATGATLNGANNVTDIDPENLGLGALADVPGSPTQVHVPNAGSIVVDVGDPDLQAGEAGTPEFDQTGRPRIVNDIIDIGAVEFNPDPPAAGGGGNGSLGFVSLAALISLYGLRRRKTGRLISPGRTVE